MILYQHRRNDTNAIFYIGIGSEIKRAYKRSGRNKHWHHIVNKHGYSVDILKTDIEPNDAFKMEIELIAKYGRECDGGILVNSSTGGEAIALGAKQSDELKQIRSLRFMGEGNPMFGKKRPELMALLKRINKENPYPLIEFNKRTKSIPIIAINRSTGTETIFPSQREAARILNLDQSRIWHVLHGKARSTGNYIFKPINNQSYVNA